VLSETNEEMLTPGIPIEVSLDELSGSTRGIVVKLNADKVEIDGRQSSIEAHLWDRALGTALR
jgi:hypothetical protein